MNQTPAWDLVQRLTEHQRDVLYGGSTEFDRAVGREVSWQTVRRLGNGVLSKGYNNKKIPTVERVLGLEQMTIQLLTERHDEELMTLPHTDEVRRYLLSLLRPAQSTRPPRNRKLA